MSQGPWRDLSPRPRPAVPLAWQPHVPGQGPSPRQTPGEGTPCLSSNWFPGGMSSVTTGEVPFGFSCCLCYSSHVTCDPLSITMWQMCFQLVRITVRSGDLTCNSCMFLGTWRCTCMSSMSHIKCRWHPVRTPTPQCPRGAGCVPDSGGPVLYLCCHCLITWVLRAPRRPTCSDEHRVL